MIVELKITMSSQLNTTLRNRRGEITTQSINPEQIYPVALNPRSSGHHDVQHSALSVQHTLVDGALVLGELATHRELKKEREFLT